MSKSDRKRKVVLAVWPRLMDIDTASLYLGLSPRTVRNGLGKKAEKKFPVKPKRHGRKLVFERKDLDAYADSLPYENYD